MQIVLTQRCDELLPRVPHLGGGTGDSGPVVGGSGEFPYFRDVVDLRSVACNGENTCAGGVCDFRCVCYLEPNSACVDMC